MKGLRASISGLASDFVAVLRTRVELFGLELAEEKSRLLSLVGLAFAALLFLTLALLVFSLLIAALYWPTEHRYLALGVLAAVYGAIGLGLLLVVRHRLVSGRAPFAYTVEELSRDVAAMTRAQAGDRPPADDDPARER